MKLTSFIQDVIEKLRRHFGGEMPLVVAAITVGITVTALSVVGAGGIHANALVVVGLMQLFISILFLSGTLGVIVTDSLIPQVKSKRTSVSEWLQSNGKELVFFILVVGLAFVVSTEAFGQVRIPGSDESQKLQAAGTLLMLMDTALFVWLARIFAGLCVLSAGWLIKEQKFGPAVVCVVGAMIIGTSPMWVKNIFEIGGGGGVFR